MQPTDKIFDSNILEGCILKDKDSIIHKLNAFAVAGAGSLLVVSDFDLTLTAGKQPGRNLGMWDVIDEWVSVEGVRRHAEIYQSFRPLELSG